MNLYLTITSDYRTGREIFVWDQDELFKYYCDLYDSDNVDDGDTDPEIKEIMTKLIEQHKNGNLYIDGEDFYRLSEESVLSFVEIDENYIRDKDFYHILLLTGSGIMGEDKVIKLIALTSEQYDNNKKILPHIFSDINGSQEFVVTGHTCSYKEEGHYPKALPRLVIDHKEIVTDEILETIEDDFDIYYCCAVIIKDGNLVKMKQIMPVF